MWQSITLPAEFSTHRISGNPDEPKERRWNLLFLVWFFWNTAAIFTVPLIPAGGYYVGFRDHAGRVKVNTTKRSDPHFAVLVGHEDCEFFALTEPSEHGLRVALVHSGVHTRRKVRDMGVPLL